MFDGRVASYGLKTTVMVRENESIGADNHARTEARKVHNAVLYGIIVVVKCTIRQCKSLAFHLIKDCSWEVIKRPHAFIRT